MFRLSSLETNEFAGRMARIERAVGEGVFVVATVDRAWRERQLAERCRDQGRKRRPLDDVVVGWKDVFDIAGHPTRAGTRFLGNEPAPADHPLVTRLKVMGAICAGKTSLAELAFSVLGENEVVPSPSNPWSAHARVCGGSSSGSAAAVAHKLVDVAVGTDCGGSVRLPAAWCGVVGFKPTAGRIPTAGVVPFAPSFDTIGQLGPTVAAVSALYTALSGHNPDTVARDLPVRLVWLRLPEPLRPGKEVAAVYERALRDLAATGIATREADCDPITRAHELRDRFGGSIANFEGASLWRDTIHEAGDQASPRLRRRAAETAKYPTRQRRALHKARREFIMWFASVLPPDTVLVLPTSPIEPPPLNSLADDHTYNKNYAQSHSLLWPFNELDAPAISIPCGRTANGLPVGLQIVAPQGSDHDVLRAATVAEAALAKTVGQSARKATQL